MRPVGARRHSGYHIYPATLQGTAMITSETLREWCSQARRKPVPLSEAIDMLQQAADELDLLVDLLHEIGERGET